MLSLSFRVSFGHIRASPFSLLFFQLAEQINRQSADMQFPKPHVYTWLHAPAVYADQISVRGVAPPLPKPLAGDS